MELFVVVGSDVVICVWCVVFECFQFFDVVGIWGGGESFFYGYNGFIICFGFDVVNFYFGLWDMFICVWDWNMFQILNQFLYNDWVWVLVF